MLTIEGIVEVDGTRLTVLPARLNREVSGTHGGLSHVVDAVEEVGLIIVRLGEVRRVRQDCGKDLAHDILLCTTQTRSLSQSEWEAITYHAVQLVRHRGRVVDESVR